MGGVRMCGKYAANVFDLNGKLNANMKLEPEQILLLRTDIDCDKIFQSSFTNLFFVFTKLAQHT